MNPTKSIVFRANNNTVTWQLPFKIRLRYAALACSLMTTTAGVDNCCSILFIGAAAITLPASGVYENHLLQMNLAAVGPAGATSNAIFAWFNRIINIGESISLSCLAPSNGSQMASAVLVYE
jgi:hypothetical protein